MTIESGQQSSVFLADEVFGMINSVEKETCGKKEVYGLLAAQLESVTGDVPYMISNLANASALLFDALEDINWAGFYIMKEDYLVLGPFQGKPACVKIEVGRGVCGTAVAEDQVQLVKNVHEFPGHIACDSASNSEIVLPIHRNGKIFGVLDIDSPTIGRFDEEDREGLLKFVSILERVNVLEEE